jgi:hypothetical protein
MAIERQIVGIPFAGGVDTKTDPKQIGPGKLSGLGNAHFQNPKSIHKRTGNAALGSLTQATSGFSHVATYQDRLTAMAGYTFQEWSTTATAWEARSYGPSYDSPPTSVDWISFESGYKKITKHDVAQIGNYQFIVYVTDANEIYYIVRDASSKTIIVTDTYIGTALYSVQPRVVALRTNFILFYLPFGTAQLKWFSYAAATGASSTGNVGTTDFDLTAGKLDAIGVNGSYNPGRAYVAYMTTAANTSTIRYIDDTLSFGANHPTWTTYITTSDAIAMCNAAGTSTYADNITVVWQDSGAWLRQTRFTMDLGTQETPVNMLNSLAVMMLSIQGTGVNTYDLVMNYSYTNSGVTAYAIRVYQSTNAAIGSMSSPCGLTSGLFLASKFLPGGRYFWALYNSYSMTSASASLQKCYFLLNRFGQVVSKCMAGLAGLASLGYSQPSLSFQIGKAPLSPDGQTGIAAVTITDPSTTGGSLVPTLSIEGCNNLMLSGGMVQSYDGQLVLEHGFPVYPESPAVTGLSAGATNSYQYVLVYEWVDARGQTQFSRPSLPTTVTSSAVVSGGNQASVKMQPLFLGLKAALNYNTIGIYRTIANGTVFYRVANVANATSALAITYTDSMTDAVLTTKAAIYTNGSPATVFNDQINGVSQMVVFRNRVFAIDAEYPLRLWYSQKMVQGNPVEWSSLLTATVDSAGGPIKAICPLDDKLVIFKSDRIFYLTGDGPDVSGANSDYSINSVACNVGCSEPRSIVAAPGGITFQSSSGLWHLNRSLQEEYIGADVEQYALASTAVGATLKPGTTRIAIPLQSNGYELVFDYHVNQWALNSLPAVIYDICQYGSTLCRLVSVAGTYYVWQDTAAFDDASNYIQLSAATTWINFSQIQGFQRVRRVVLLGDWKSSHRLTWAIYKDYEQSPVQTGTTTYATNPGNGLIQLRIDMKYQKCEAIKIQLYDSKNGTDANGEGLSLSAITLEVGIKRGTAKLPASKQTG